MAEFNPDLHAFLLENETCMWSEKGNLKFGVHVHFFELDEFVKLLGHYALDDGGIECTLNNEYTLYIPLENHFMNHGYTIHYFKCCFDSDVLEQYQQEIEKFDS